MDELELRPWMSALFVLLCAISVAAFSLDWRTAGLALFALALALPIVAFVVFGISRGEWVFSKILVALCSAGCALLIRSDPAGRTLMTAAIAWLVLGFPLLGVLAVAVHRARRSMRE